MRVVFRMSAIVAALAVATSVSMAGCGQRGPLYLPSVPPLPAKPVEHTEPSTQAAPAVSPDSETSAPPASERSTSKPLTLAPADDLGSAPSHKRAPSPASAASGTLPGSNQ